MVISLTFVAVATASGSAPAWATSASEPAAPASEPEASPNEPRAQETNLESRPKRLPYDPTQPIPEGYVYESRGNKWLWVSGLGFLAGGWVGTGMAIGFGADPAIGIPIVGPWLPAFRGQALTQTDVKFGSVQLIGVALLVTGLSIREQFLVREDLVDVRVGPMLVEGTGLGAGIHAAF